ncbi:MAG: ABC transporter permease [Porphyromonadaceae bacterium]|nr:ABC transporter permease [Porphyromonadaceae bacterium]
MNVELFIAKRIYAWTGKNNSVRRPPAIRIAIGGVILGMAIMILAVSIVIGFKREISEKVIGFGSHIQITGSPAQNVYEISPIALSPTLDTLLKGLPTVTDYALFAAKPGIIKTDTDFLGIILKGITKEYPTDFLQAYLTEGTLPQLDDEETVNEILLSRYIADKLQLQVGDAIYCYFVDESVRARKFFVSGIYQTNLTEYDRFFVFGDARQVQQLNRWANDQYSGIEIRLNDIDAIESTNDILYASLLFQKDRYNAPYFSHTIRDLNPQLFNWLDLLNMNVWVILILMLLVSGFTMISGLLVIILEHTRMIGILKVLGYSNLSIRKIFLYVSTFLVGKGMLWGDIVGLVLCFLQYQFHIIKLNPEIYYIPSVPIAFPIGYLILLNVLAFLVSVLMLLGPSYIITRIYPARTIKFE